MTTAQSPAKPVAQKSVAKKPAAKKVASKPAAAPAAVETPVVEAPAAAVPVIETPVVAAPVPALDDVAAKVKDDALKSYAEASAVAKDALDAVVASSEVLSQGLQYLGDTVCGLAQQSLDDGFAATKRILAAKTIRELVDLQSSLAKTQVDRLLAEGPRLSDLSVKLVEDTMAPLSASLNALVDKMVKTAA